MSQVSTNDPAALLHQPAGGIDPRAPQFNAAITAVILIAALAVPARPIAVALTAIQAVLFAIGAIRGVKATPHAWLFRALVRPRLAPPTALEDPAPPRFAQAVGLGFAVAALIAFAFGSLVAADVFLGLALVAALLNAIFRFCLGCEIYLLIARLRHR